MERISWAEWKEVQVLWNRLPEGPTICYSTSGWGWKSIIYMWRRYCYVTVVELCCLEKVPVGQAWGWYSTKTAIRYCQSLLSRDALLPINISIHFLLPLGPPLSLSISYLHALTFHGCFQLSVQVYELSARASLLQHEALLTSIPAAQAAKSLAGWGDFFLSVFVFRKPFCNDDLNSYLRLKSLGLVIRK